MKRGSEAEKDSHPSSRPADKPAPTSQPARFNHTSRQVLAKCWNVSPNPGGAKTDPHVAGDRHLGAVRNLRQFPTQHREHNQERTTQSTSS
jgi:hypothetical protein